jgi:hypothetical protein
MEPASSVWRYVANETIRQAIVVRREHTKDGPKNRRQLYHASVTNMLQDSGSREDQTLLRTTSGASLRRQLSPNSSRA